MDRYMKKRMASIVSLEKIEIIGSQEFMLSKSKAKHLKKKDYLRAILGPQFCRILVLGSHFWWARGPGPQPPPGPAPALTKANADLNLYLN